MNNLIKNCSFSLLILLVGFLIFPQASLAVTIEDINTKEISGYLEFPEQDTKNLLKALNQPFTDKLINIASSSNVHPAEQVALVTLRRAIKINVLDYLFIDAPIEIVGGIVKNTIEIARILYAADPSVVLEKIEKKSVEKAIEYGENWLLKNEIRFATNAIPMKYNSYRGNAQEPIFQYIIVFKPLNEGYGEIIIRIYSPESIEPPPSEGGIMTGTPWPETDWLAEGNTELPPFIIRIQGKVEKSKETYHIYSWVGNPSVEVTFPENVPDLGIESSGFWEGRITKSIKGVQNEIRKKQIVLKGLLGRFAGVTESLREFTNSASEMAKSAAGNIWAKIRSLVSGINLGGILVQNPALISSREAEELQELQESLEFIINEEIQSEVQQPEAEIEQNQSEQVKVVDIREQQPENVGIENPYIEPKEERKMSLEEIIEVLDDIAEEIDVIGAEVAVLVTTKSSAVAEATSKEEFLDGQVSESEKIAQKESGESEEKQEELTELTQEEQSEQSEQQEKVVVASSPPPLPQILISEVCAGVNKAANEYIELYNPNNFDATITSDNFKLKLVNSSNEATPKRITFINNTIPAKGYFLLAAGEIIINSQLISPGATYSQQLTSSSGVIITGSQDNIKDKVAWGSPAKPAPSEAVEGMGISLENGLKTGESLGRKWDSTSQTYKDSDNNRSDFESQDLTPKLKNRIKVSIPEQSSNSSSSGGGWVPPPSPTPPAPAPKILINEVQLEGQTKKDEFIELYNPNDTEVNLANWSLKKKTAAGNESNLVSSAHFSGVIPSLGYFLIVPQSDDEGSAQYKGEAESNLPYSVADNSVAPDNTVLLYDPNNYLIDKLGFGDVQDFETAPFSQNPEANQSIGRKWDSETQEYPDIDDNSLDFEIQNPTPKAQNETLVEPAGGGGPGGAPNVCDSEHLNLCFTQGDCEIAEGYWYDDLCNSAPVFILADNVIISEVQIADKEFIELFNPTEGDIDMSDWYLSYFSPALDEEGNPKYDWDNPYRNKSFSEALLTIIPAQSYYLIGLQGYPEEDGNPNSDWQVYESNQFNNEAGAIAIFSESPKEDTDGNTRTPEQAESYKIDALGWGTTLVREEEACLAPAEGKSLQRKRDAEENYIDANNNLQDFEVPEYISPTNSTGLAADIIPPTVINDLAIQENPYNKVVLSWTAPNDPDSLQENLSYEIRYSKNQEITEENWSEAILVSEPPVVAATGESQTITIPDLYYDSTYYFSVKTFDQWNYSLLSNIALQQILPAVHIWKIFMADSQHTGRSSFIGPVSSELTILISKIHNNDYFGSPAIGADNTIYLGATTIDNKWGLYAFNLDGTQKWFYPGGAVSPPVLGKDGTIYTYAVKDVQEGTVIVSLSPAGIEKWSRSSNIFSQSIRLLIDEQDNIYTFNLISDGNGYTGFTLIKITPEGVINEIYQFNSDEGYLESNWLTSPSMSPDKTIYFGFKNVFYALNPNGSIKWQQEFTDTFQDSENLASFLTTPIISSEGNIYFFSNHLQGVSSEGALLWESNASIEKNTDYPSYTGALGLDGTIYTTLKTSHNESRNLYLYAINGLTGIDALAGQEKWSKGLHSAQHSGLHNSSLPVVDAQGNVFISAGNDLMAFNSIGDLLWEKQNYRSVAHHLTQPFLAIGANNTLYASGYTNFCVVSP